MSTAVVSGSRKLFTDTTSGVFGSFTKKDIDTHLSLIRRKVQEKCSSIQELMAQVRRTKVGEGNSVTPVEFRYTLAKFGIIMTQAEVTRVFNVFDSDRSGTMDFDEFAMWIMNSEFQPEVIKETPGPTPQQKLHTKFKKCMENYPTSFALFKKHVTFMDLVSEMTSYHDMGVTEKEVRAIFQILDINDTGLIATERLLSWGRSGIVPVLRKAERPTSTPELQTAIRGVAGNNFNGLDESFAHIKKGDGVKMPYDEFRMALLSNGLGWDEKNCNRLFRACTSTPGYADIDKLRNALPTKGGSIKIKAANFKPEPAEHIPGARAERLLREAMRKSHHLLKLLLEKMERWGQLDRSGFIEQRQLYQLVMKFCKPIGFPDWRYMLRRIKRDLRDRVSWKQFIHLMDPKKAPHQLNGTIGIPSFADREYVYSTNSGQQTAPKRPKNKTTLNSLTDNSKKLNPRERAKLKAEQAELDAQELERLYAEAMSATLPADQINDVPEVTSGETSRPQSPPRITRDPNDPLFQPNTGMKKIWHAVLKKCHAIDNDGQGIVARNKFSDALESQGMAPDAVSKIADMFATDEWGERIDYLGCFRHFLTHGKQASTNDNFKVSIGTESRKKGSSHPWEFGYNKREPVKFKDDYVVPYWKTATKIDRDVSHESKMKPVSATEMVSNYWALKQDTIDVLAKDSSLNDTVARPSTVGATSTRTLPALDMAYYGYDMNAASQKSLATSQSMQSLPSRPQTAAVSLSNVGVESTTSSQSSTMKRAKSASTLRKSRSSAFPTISELNLFEKQRILSKYNDKSIEYCRHVLKKVGAYNWKRFSIDLRDRQMNRYKGHILAKTYFELLQSEYNWKISSNDMGACIMGFRGLGGGMVVKFDEMLHVCQLVKVLDAELPKVIPPPKEEELE